MKSVAIAILLFSFAHFAAAKTAAQAKSAATQPATQDAAKKDGKPEAPPEKRPFMEFPTDEIPPLILRECEKELKVRGCYTKKTMLDLHQCMNAYAAANVGKDKWSEHCMSVVKKVREEAKVNRAIWEQARDVKKRELEAQQKKADAAQQNKVKGAAASDRPAPQPTPPAPVKPVEPKK